MLSLFGLLLVRDRPGHVLTWRASHPRNIEALELAIALCRKERPTFRFIQIGACDGVTADPLRLLIQKYHLQGLLVEPLPDIYQKLRANYASEPQLAFANLAVAPVSGDMSLYRFPREATKVDAHLDGLATFDRERMEKHARRVGVPWREMEAIRVPCLSIRALVDQYGYEHVNLLCLDAEGMDAAILTSALDSNIRPDIVYMEILDMPDSDRTRVLARLAGEGYRLHATASDLLAIQSSFAPD